MRIAQVAPLAESVPPKLYGGSPNHLALAGFLFPCPWAGNPPTSLSEGHGPGLGIVVRRFSITAAVSVTKSSSVLTGKRVSQKTLSAVLPLEPPAVHLVTSVCSSSVVWTAARDMVPQSELPTRRAA